MAVVALKSTAITNATSNPRVQNSANIEHGNVRSSRGFANITSGDSIGSTYRLMRVRSADLVDNIRLTSADLGTTTAGDLGLYDKNDVNNGAVVDVDFFGSAISLSSGQIAGVDVKYESGAAGGSLANGEKRVWECLGLTVDPHKEYDIVFTLTAAADGTGSPLFVMQYISGE